MPAEDRVDPTRPDPTRPDPTSLDVSDASLGAFSADVEAARARLDLETARLGLAFTVGELRPSDDLSPAPLSDDEEKRARAFVDAAKE